MSAHHQNVANRITLTALFSVFVFLMPAPAGSEENAVPKDLRIPPPDVNLLQKGNFWNYQVPELQPIEKYGSFFGLKITLKIEGGWNTFSGNDVKKGIMGMYDNGVDYIASTGVLIAENARDAGRGGLEVGGDLIYCLTPRFGIGVGVAGISAWKESHLLYSLAPLSTGILQSSPRVKVTTFRAGVFYSYPFASFLAISIRGGPAYYAAKYSFVVSGNTGFPRDGLTYTSYGQEAKANKWGFEGGLGFEFNPNPFVAIFVEAQGRYAKIGGLEGEEKATFFEDNQSQNSDKTGPVYFVDTGTYPELAIGLSGGAGGARRAELNFSGLTFLAGLKLRL